METAIFRISGMACGGCSNTVQQALLALNGVVDAKVSHTDGMAEVHFDPSVVQPSDLEGAITAAGYGIVK